MKNKALENNVERIKATPDVKITKGKVSGYSIEVFTEQPYEDLGSYPYYKDKAQRDADLEQLNNLLSEEDDDE